MKTINQLVITAGILLSSLTVWADNAAEKASLETYFSWRGTNYEEVIALADANQGLRDSVNTLYKNSFAVIDTAGGKYIFQGFITLDGVAPDLGKQDSLYISADAAAYLGDNDYTAYLQSKFTQNISQAKDEIGKCTEDKLIVFGELPCRVEGINYALSGGMTYVVQKLMKSGNVDIAKCALNSDVYFKAAARLMDLFGNSTIYKAAKKKPLIYEVPLAKAKRLKFLNQETYGRKVTKGNFGTICLAKQFTSMEGVEGLYVPSYMTPDTTTLYCVEMPLDSVKAGYSYIFKSNADSVTFFMEGEASGVHTHNYMKGNLEGDSEVTTEMIPYMDGLYVLANNELVKPAVESVIKNNTAMIILIDVPTTKPASVAGRKMVAIGRNTPTSIVDVNATHMSDIHKKVYNGQFIIIRDGRKFNAQGQEL